SSGSLRAGTLAAAHLVLDPTLIADGAPHTGTRSPAPRSRAEAARSGIQHVLRRPAAAAAVGDARPRRVARETIRSRAHPEHRRPLSLPDAAVPFRRLRRSLGPWAPRSRRRAAGSLFPHSSAARTRQDEARGPHSLRRIIP